MIHSATTTAWKPLALAVVTALALWSCDVIDAPYRETPVDPGPTDSIPKRKILVEDFTGFKCPNCPAASDLAKELADLYDGQVYIVSVHAGYYAKPDPIPPFDYDFRNATATGIADFFKVPQYPNGMVNRLLPAGANSRMLDAGQWGGMMASIVNAEADMAVEVENSYNAATRALTVNVDIDYLKAQAADNYLAVYILEDSIVKPQIDNRKPLDQQKVLNYVHDHVLRGAVNGQWWGERLSETAIAAETTIEKQYTITLDPSWRAEHCRVLVYVHRFDPSYTPTQADAGQLEILQVEEAHVTE